MYGIDPNRVKINGKNAFNLSRMNQVLVEQRQKKGNRITYLRALYEYP